MSLQGSVLAATDLLIEIGSPLAGILTAAERLAGSAGSESRSLRSHPRLVARRGPRTRHRSRGGPLERPCPRDRRRSRPRRGHRRQWSRDDADRREGDGVRSLTDCHRHHRPHWPATPPSRQRRGNRRPVGFVLGARGSSSGRCRLAGAQNRESDSGARQLSSPATAVEGIRS